MRIGMILDAPFPPDYRVEKEAMTLSEAGHSVFLFCLVYSGKYNEETYKGIQLRRYPSNKLEYKLSALAYTIPIYHRLMSGKIEDFVKKNKPEVLHVHDMVIAGAAFQVARRYNLNVVLDLHENRPAIMKEYRHLKRFPGKYLVDLDVWNRKQLELVTKANKVIVVTDLAKLELANSTAKSPDDIVVLPNTPSIKFTEYPLEDSLLRRMSATFNLLYIGDTSERRGTLDMLEATAVLKEKIPRLALWIVGTSSFDPELRIKAAELKITDSVHFEGWQPEKLFPSYITGSHICLSPLKRNLHHDTTFANKIFQYMSLGRPSVVSNCTAQAELIDKEGAGLVYDPAVHGALNSRLDELFRDPEKRARLGESARKAVLHRWNWEITATALKALYNER